MSAPEHVDTTQLAETLKGQGVLIDAGESFFGGDNRPKHFYRLAYSSIPASRITKGVSILAQAIKDA